MKKIKLDIVDARMLELGEYLQEKGDIRFLQELWDAIEFDKQSLWNVKSGKQHFTIKHVMNACEAYNLNANWFFGFSDNKFRRQIPVTKTVTKYSKKATRLVK